MMADEEVDEGATNLPHLDPDVAEYLATKEHARPCGWWIFETGAPV